MGEVRPAIGAVEPLRPTDRRVVVDVGANVGDFAIEVATRNPGVVVLAVEPVSPLADQLVARARDRGLTNVAVRTVAVAEQARQAQLNVAESGDWGVTSLLHFAQDMVAADEYWRHREDLAFTRQQTVDVVRLETLLSEVRADIVDFIKIDVQGLDLEVLASAGAAMALVRGGMLEVATAPRVRLYADEQAHLSTALPQLHEWGFEVYAIKPNDPACNEVNVYFARPEEDPALLERELSLRGIPLYDGKHFWSRSFSTWDALRRDEEGIHAQAARLALLDARVQEVEGALVACESQLSEALTELARRGDRIGVLDVELSQREQRIASLDEDLLVRQDRIAALDTELARQEGAMSQLVHRLEEQDARIRVLEAGVQRRQA